MFYNYKYILFILSTFCLIISTSDYLKYILLL